MRSFVCGCSGFQAIGRVDHPARLIGVPAHDATVPQKAGGNHVPVSAASTNSARVLNSLRRYQMLRTPGDGEVRLWPEADMEIGEEAVIVLAEPRGWWLEIGRAHV